MHTKTHAPSTLVLKRLLKRHPEIKTLLIQSIHEAVLINPDPRTNPITSLKAYYKFIDQYAGLLPNFSFDTAHTITRKNISNGIALFYFVVDQPLKALEDRGFYRPVLQYYPRFAEWMAHFVESWGWFLSTPQSWSDNIYKQLKTSGSFKLDTDWYAQTNIWTTWNDWFSRHLAHPERSHPIQSPDNPRVVISPADSTPNAT